jgi:hypothetical protein
MSITLPTPSPPGIAPVNGHPVHQAPTAEPQRPAAEAPVKSRPPFMLTVIALLGAGLSFNAVRVHATPFAGFYGGIATACLFDAGMWLSSRWYIRTVREGKPLRPALWLSMALVAVTLAVNIAPAHNLTERIVFGIGPALFAAFTWLEAALVLREYRKSAEVRDRIPLGFALAHPTRALRVVVMMLSSGQNSFTAASGMCQNREAQRRCWKAEHRPRYLAWIQRVLRPGWRGKVDPVLYTAYRWGAFDTNALILPALTATRPTATDRPTDGQSPATGAANTAATNGRSGGQSPAKSTATKRPSRGQSTADRVAKATAKNPSLTAAEVAAKLGIGERTARRYMTGN